MPPQGFRPEGEIPRRHTVNIEKISICLNRGREDSVGMMTFLLFAPASTKWLEWRKHKKSRRDRLQWVDFVTLIAQSYFDTLLRYLLSVTFCGAVVMKVMDQKTLVKRRWSYKVRITVYILTLLKWRFARHEFTNLWLETLPDTLFLRPE